MSPDFVEYNTILTLLPKRRVIVIVYMIFVQVKICHGDLVAYFVTEKMTSLWLAESSQIFLKAISKRVSVWNIQQWTPKYTTRDVWKFFQIALA